MVQEIEAEPPGPNEPAVHIESSSEEKSSTGTDGTRPRTHRRRPCRIVAIASGKGGVGKSMLSSSVSIYLAQIGKEVVLIDAALGASNLHTLVGLEQPTACMHDFLRKDAKELNSVISPTPFEGLGLIAGSANRLGAANPRPAQKKRLLAQMRALKADYVVVDSEAGSGFNALDTFLAGDVHVIVTQPEPTAIESAFRFIKSAFLRGLRDIDGFDRLIDEAEEQAHFGVPIPDALRSIAKARAERFVEPIEALMSRFRPLLVLNNVRAREDLELGPALALLGQRHLGLAMEYAGHIEADDLVWVSVRRRRPLLVEYPEAKVSRDIERIARRLVSEPEERNSKQLPNTSIEALNHYELLGVHAASSEEEIRRAHRAWRRIYGEPSNAIYGVVAPAAASKLLSQVDEAYATLVDRDKQHAYNQTLFPDGVSNTELPKAESQTETQVAASVVATSAVSVEPTTDKRPPVDENTEYTGELLRQIREADGVDLKDVSERTKIALPHLIAIENENFENAPAPVYLRGFIKAVAHYLKLPADVVANSYMKRYENER